MSISSFHGEYAFLSNFHPCKITLGGVTYASVEHAYQASKTNCPNERKRLEGVTAGQAKRLGASLTLRPDWFSIRVAVMRGLLAQKFARDTPLGDALKATGDQLLEEGNNWNDRFWGVCAGRGENMLGKLLMEWRTVLQKHSLFED